MIVVDTSALIAILKGEPGAERYRATLEREPANMSIATMFETNLVCLRHRVARDRVDGLIRFLAIDVVDVGPAQIPFFLEGMDRFGRGRAAPPAVLNFGDLFAYALARERNLPLLYKGEDFAATDVRAALA